MLRSGLGICGLAAISLLIAQAPDSQEIRFSSVPYFPRTGVAIKTETRLVDVGVVVRDDRGRAIGGLTKDDFQVADNGKRHPITAFSTQMFVAARSNAATPEPGDAPKTATPQAPSKPRFLGLVFDDLTMPVGDLTYVKNAAKKFVETGLAETDRVAVFTT